MIKNKHTLGLLKCALVAGWVLTGCGGSASNEVDPAKLGTLGLPLTTYGPSGAQYQLRHANFDIVPYSYYYGGYSTGGASNQQTMLLPTTASSDTNPDAPSIEVDLEQGQYQIYLQPGWSLERVENGVSTPVEAQLLSGETQWAYVSPHSTSWVSYQFGIGGRSLWLNGKVNIDVQVYEDPNQYYGGPTGGYAGAYFGETGGQGLIIAPAPESNIGGHANSVGGAASY
ncbi:MAG: hypothetical protein SFV15_02470 [Polyangiaceae bacterium]|nr:hypothetical protein [Polyangiaceae bacterium]